MFTTGSKLFLGGTVLSIVAAVAISTSYDGNAAWTAGIGLIGFVNFAVSFGLSLSLAMRSRAIPYRDLSAILLAIGRHARRHPLRFLVPTRASARAEVPNG